MAITIKYPFGQSASIGGAELILVTTLPTASSSTMGDIYLVPRTGSDVKDMYITVSSNGAYTWTTIGTTEFDFQLPFEYAPVEEDGFFYVDSYLNIGAKMDNNGLSAFNLLTMEDV